MRTVCIHPPKTPVTKGSNSISAATIPNVCKMPPPPPPFVPTPLPNIGRSSIRPQGYSTTVKMEGNAIAILGASFGSMGDVASRATGGGIISNNCEGPTKFISPGSFTVQVQGKNVHLLGDLMSNNNGPAGSPPNAATLAGTIHEMAMAGGESPMPVKCSDAFPARPATDCEKEEICSKCASINRAAKRKKLKRLTGQAKKDAQDARDAKCAAVNKLAKENPKEASKIGFAATSPKCVKAASEECEKSGFAGFSADHKVDVTLGGHPSRKTNLAWMSSKANSWMGPVMQHYKPEAHTGVKPDCC